MKKLGFGCMRLPIKDTDYANVDLELVNKMVDDFLEKGFTYFDTAYMYHNYKSEIAVREALVKRHKRDSFTLATKLPSMFLKEEGDTTKRNIVGGMMLIAVSAKLISSKQVRQMGGKAISSVGKSLLRLKK